MNLCENCFKEKTGDVCTYCGYNGQSPNDKSIIKPGTIINNKYVFGKSLGRGGFGISYLAYDILLNMTVCIKEYFPSAISARKGNTTFIVPFTGESEANFEYGKDQFVEEGRTLAKFNKNSSIVTVYDFFEANGTAYIVMEFLDGIDLRAYLSKQPDKKMNWERTIELLNPVLVVLCEVHKQGVIHRDISPDNIFITRDNQVKLLDFGAARNAMGEQEKSMSVILKHGYAPFEQYSRNKIQGPWTDIYAICATMYRCITGVKPPDSTDRIEQDSINLPSSLGCAIPDYVENAIMKGLSVNYQQRYQSVEQLIEALDGKKNKAYINAKMDNTYFNPSKAQNVNAVKNTSDNSKSFVIKMVIGIAAILATLIVVVVFVYIKNEPDEQPEYSNSQVVDNQTINSSQNNSIKTDEDVAFATMSTVTPLQKSTPESSELETTPVATSTPIPIKEDARWNVSVSSHLIPNDSKYVYTKEMLTDNNYLTCWVPGNNRNGIGESITLEVINGELAYFSDIYIYAGYGKPKRYLTNLRAKDVTVFLDGNYYSDFKLEDVDSMQTIDLFEEVSAYTVKIVFNSYYNCEEVSGTKSYEDLCISEIGIDGYVIVE